MKDAEQFLKQLNIESGQNKDSANHSSHLEDGLLASELAYQVESRAVGLLARREHGKRELRQKLKQKFPENSELLERYDVEPGDIERIVDFVLQKCQDNKWQSDERYIEQAVHSYINKGHGPLKIGQKLQQNCDNRSLIDAALDIGDDDWRELAREALLKKYGDTAQPASRNEQGKRMRFLQSRGFPPGLIWKAFD